MGEKRRKKGSGYKLYVQKKLRISAKEYTTSSNVKKPGRKPPVTQVVRKCRYKCSTLALHQKEHLFTTFYKCDYSTQNNYLMGLMEIVPVQRHGTYTKPENSQRRSTITYSVPDGEGNSVQVCRQTFIDIFAISRSTLQTIATRKKEWGN
ncbi:hypothetical protein L9F63_019239, partial [Diploptera punctata]